MSVILTTTQGTPPATFRNAARKQITSFYNSTASFIDNAIASITPENSTNATTIFRAKDSKGVEYTARKIVLATGLVDDLPATPGLREGFGKGIYWCPWCDGYEHRDQPYGILGTLHHIVSSVTEISTLNKDIIAFVNGSYTDEEVAILDADPLDWRAAMKAYNVQIDNRTITSFERVQDGGNNRSNDGKQFDIFRIHFTEGEPVIRNAFLTNFETSQRSSIPSDMGLKMEDGKIDTSTKSGLRTSLDGVWGIGDANNDGSTNVPHAMWSGKRAAVFSHGMSTLFSLL
jgi:thioredoxin reductase